MNKEQVRHSKAMAKKIKQHAKSIVSSMEIIERMEINHSNYIPVTNVINTFTHDMGYGVQDRLEAIESVITDMIEELHENIDTSPDDTPQPPY